MQQLNQPYTAAYAFYLLFFLEDFAAWPTSAFPAFPAFAFFFVGASVASVHHSWPCHSGKGRIWRLTLPVGSRHWWHRM